MTMTMQVRSMGRLAAVAVLLAALSAGGCAAPAATPPRVLAPELVATPAHLPEIVDAKSGVSWHTCADLIQALRADRVPEEVTELPQFNSWAGCQSAALVAQGTANDGLDAHDAGDRLYRYLDLATVESSLAQDRPADHYVLADFKSAKVETTPTSVTLHDKGFVYELRVLAVGDFRHAGHGEWLVRFIERSVTGGSYDRTAILVVDPVGDAGLAATDALEALRAKAR